MAYRGRLIRPLLVEIYPLDLSGTAVTPPGYDPVYREPRKVPSADRLGSAGRVEAEPVRVQAQIEPQSLQRMSVAATGDVAKGSMTLVLFLPELESLGLVDSETGAPVFKRGDRLGAVRKLDGTLVQQIPDPPGLYITEVCPSFGLSGDRNLLIVTVESRDQGK